MSPRISTILLAAVAHLDDQLALGADERDEAWRHGHGPIPTQAELNEARSAVLGLLSDGPPDHLPSKPVQAYRTTDFGGIETVEVPLKIKVGDTVVGRCPGSWVDGRKATVLALGASSSDGVRGCLLQVDGLTAAGDDPDRLTQCDGGKTLQTVVESGSLEKLDGYAECYAAVMAGRKVTLAVAAYDDADFYCPSIPGRENGVYDCWLQVEGRDPGHPAALFQLRRPTGVHFMADPASVRFYLG